MVNKPNLIVAAGTGISLAAALMCATDARAHSPSDPAAVGDIAKLSAASNLIIQGKVKSVTYRQHKIGGNDVPYAYVTFSVKSRMLGVSGNDVTLRFIGGPDGQGGFVSAEGVPTFSAGDEDILFVKSNGDNGCPLVMCEFGRFRLLNGEVYEAHGAPVNALDHGRLRAHGKVPSAFLRTAYPAPSFDDLIKNPRVLAQIKKMGLTLDQARTKYANEAPKEIVIETHQSDVGEKAAKSAATPGVSAATVLNAIRSTVATQRRAPTAMISDADPAKFTAPAVLTAAPPK